MAAVPSTSAQKLWCLARMEIASAGVVGHNPEIARRKPSDLLMVPYVVRLSWMLVSKMKLRFQHPEDQPCHCYHFFGRRLSLLTPRVLYQPPNLQD